MREHRRGHRQPCPTCTQPFQICPRARLELDCRGVRLIGEIVPLPHEFLGRVVETESADRICGDVVELHRTHLLHVVCRHVESASAEEFDIHRVPYAHRVEQRAVEVEDRRPSTVDSGCIHHIRHVPLFNLGFVQ